MQKYPLFLAVALAVLFAVATTASTAENVPELLKRQTQELVDAIGTGSPGSGTDTWTRRSASLMRAER